MPTAPGAAGVSKAGLPTTVLSSAIDAPPPPPPTALSAPVALSAVPVPYASRCRISDATNSPRNRALNGGGRTRDRGYLPSSPATPFTDRLAISRAEYSGAPARDAPCGPDDVDGAVEPKARKTASSSSWCSGRAKYRLGSDVRGSTVAAWSKARDGQTRTRFKIWLQVYTGDEHFEVALVPGVSISSASKNPYSTALPECTEGGES